VSKRLIDQVRKHGAQCGERDNAPVTGESRQHEADEDTGHGVGEEIHWQDLLQGNHILFAPER